MSSELGKKIEQLEEEKMRLGLDVDIHKLETEKLKKGKNKAEEDLDSLKMDYKKLHLSMRTEVALERSLLECQNEMVGLRARVVELEKSLH
ncbi:hypothetical protein Godav_026024 [Gossypium davidsonii]|uniref:Uncharacterized protein n=2 Tax=Gossypium TaxID=3633 RepID=A0A7J8TBL6_GOSDV|nr:hypothetical protein [Gossypium davidsonii]MBA0671935.1 hypothetical protein [Gossypium klotzschianum]